MYRDVPMMAEATAAINEFYGLMSLDALLVGNSKFEPFRHSHKRWMEDFIEYRNLYIDKLEQVIYDYTVLVVGGELRHASEYCSFALEGFPYANSRSDAYELVKDFSPDFILAAGEEGFSKYEWEEGYGGRLWADIARAGTLRNKLGKIGFIDHCVDLSHNNSVYFDKSDSDIFWLYSLSMYENFLDQKRYEKPEVVLSNIFMSPMLYRLVQRGITLGFLPKTIYLKPFLYTTESIENDYMLQVVLNTNEFILNYSPIEWGTKSLPMCWEPTGYRFGDDEDDYYEDDYYEYDYDDGYLEEAM